MQAPVVSAMFPLALADAPNRRAVDAMLEILSELGGVFELLLVEVQTDPEISDLAATLARCYPQVRTIRIGQAVDWPAALRQAWPHTRGRWVFAPDAGLRLNLHEFSRLWQRAQRCDALLAAPRRETKPFRAPSWAVRTWRTAISTSESGDERPGWLLVRREVLERFGWPPAEPRAWLADLSAAGYAWTEVALEAQTAVPADRMRPRTVRPVRGPWATPLTPRETLSS